MFTVVCSLKSICIPSFGCCVSELHAIILYVPIVMYGLRLFIVVLQELHCLLNCLHVVSSELEVAITSPVLLYSYLRNWKV